MTLAIRARAYEPNGASLGLLPAPQALSAAVVFGDVGGIDLTYPSTGPRSGVLEQPCEIALEVSHDNGTTWIEPPDARYLRLVRKGDRVDTPEARSYTGPAYIWRLSKARVLPEGLLNADGKRPFLSKNGGAIMRTLAQEAQARGALAGMDFSTFDEDHDSAGNPWSKIITLYYEPGLDYLTVLLNLHTQGLVNFRMEGRSLRLYDADTDTIMAGASGAVLLKGRDLREAPYAGSLEGVADYVYLLGDNGKHFERTNPTADAPWGRWESFITQGGVSDTGTMTVLTDAALSLAAQERLENTYGLDFTQAKALPFRDYGLGQDLLVRDGTGEPEPMRCYQITLTRDEKGVVAGNVVLNDRFLENEVRQNRRVQGITGGSTADGGSGTRPAPTGTDKMPPKPPTSLSFSSDAYLDDEGKVWATVTVNWADPTQNLDGTALTDLAGVDVYWRLDGDTTWTLATSGVDAGVETATVGGFYPNTAYEFALKAVDDDGNRSAFSAAGGVVTDDDATAPQKPSAPTVEAYLGQLLIGWDGLGDGGTALPSDFARLEWHISTVSNFATYEVVDQSTAKGPASTVATGLSYGTTYYVRAVMFDRSGNQGPYSDTTTGVPQKAAAGDIQSITANQITAGALSAAITVSGRIATALTGARVEINSTGLKAYNASGALMVDIPSDGAGPTFVGTLRTGTTGARTEILPGAAGAIIRLYSGMTSETSPGIIETILNGTGSGADARLRLTAPAKNSLPPAWLELRSRDADSGADMIADVKNGSVYWLSDVGYGTHVFTDNTAGSDWLRITRLGSGASISADGPLYFGRTVGDAYVYINSDDGNGRVDIRGANSTLGGIRISTDGGYGTRIIGYLDHSGGNLYFSDEFGGRRLHGNTDTIPYLESDVIYARASGASANMVILSNGIMARATSALKYKINVDRTWMDEAPLESIKSLRPATYYDRQNAERYADLVDPAKDVDEDVWRADFPRRHLGLIAEDVAALAGLDELVIRDEAGEIEGLAYDRLAVVLLPWLHDLERRLNALERAQGPVGSSA